MGAGKSGVAAANFLAGREVDVSITDAKREEELPLASSIDPRVHRVLGEQSSALLDGADLVVLSPGIPPDVPLLMEAHARSLPVISEIELAFRHLQGKVVAITGSNGKSTTTALIGEILKVAGYEPIVAGNIGEPLIGSIDPTRSRHYVIELSSFQLETVESFHADVALLLNITPDHMDRYRSMEEYAAAKLRIFRNQAATDTAIVNADDVRTSTPPTPARVWRFSSRHPVDRGAWLEGEALAVSLGDEDRRIPRSALRIEGTANVENALAAWLAARAMGIGDVDVQIAFGSFTGLPHRMVKVRELDGVRWINDSKGTNVDATVKSLEGMPDGRVILILGGKDKKGEFERLRDLVSRKARNVLTIGTAAGRVEEALAGTVEIVPCGDMNRAVEWAHSHAAERDVVLLSPACASFDQYRNFEQRGEHFEELVRGLREGAREGDR